MLPLPAGPSAPRGALAVGQRPDDLIEGPVLGGYSDLRPGTSSLTHSGATHRPPLRALSGADLARSSTNRQAWHVNELTQLGVSSRAYTPGPYANQEGLLAAFDRHYARALNAAGARART